MKRYVLGHGGKAPAWCRNQLMAFRRMDGSAGFEFYGIERVFTLKPGDMLAFQQGRIEIIYRGGVANDQLEERGNR